MHLKKILIAAALLVFFEACTDAGKTDSTAEKSDSTAAAAPESREKKLYTETMDIHNEVMAKMGKLNGYKKRVQQQADSIRSMLAYTDFPRQVAQRIASDLDTLEQLGKNLQAADSSMNAWMERFNPDPQLANTEANADYFEKQKVSAEAMKKKFFEALAAADKKFGSNNK